MGEGGVDVSAEDPSWVDVSFGRPAGIEITYITN